MIVPSRSAAGTRLDEPPRPTAEGGEAPGYAHSWGAGRPRGRPGAEVSGVGGGGGGPTATGFPSSSTGGGSGGSRSPSMGDGGGRGSGARCSSARGGGSGGRCSPPTGRGGAARGPSAPRGTGSRSPGSCVGFTRAGFGGGGGYELGGSGTVEPYQMNLPRRGDAGTRKVMSSRLELSPGLSAAAVEHALDTVQGALPVWTYVSQGLAAYGRARSS